MSEMEFCPACKTNIQLLTNNCNTCGFPFDGTDQEKSKHIASQIIKKSKITDTRDDILKSRRIILVIGIINIVSSFFFS